MKMTERLTYLLVILGTVCFGLYQIWWFSGHYDYLNEQLKVVRQICVDAGIERGGDIFHKQCDLKTGVCKEIKENEETN
jgi:hypothetical protein